MGYYPHDKIVELFDAGKSLEEIAEIVGCAVSRASQILKEHGRSAWNRRYPHMQDLDDEQLFLDYQSGMRIDALLEKHQIKSSTLYRHLKRGNIPCRPRKGLCGPKNHQYKHGKGSRTIERNQSLTKQVAALCLGYIVPRGWHIHHLDGEPSNNHPENLAIFHNKSEHANFHQQQLRLQREGAEVDASQLVLENGGFLLPLPPYPILLPREKGRLDPRKPRQKPKPSPEGS